MKKLPTITPIVTDFSVPDKGTPEDVHNYLKSGCIVLCQFSSEVMKLLKVHEIFEGHRDDKDKIVAAAKNLLKDNSFVAFKLRGPKLEFFLLEDLRNITNSTQKHFSAFNMKAIS